MGLWQSKSNLSDGSVEGYWLVMPMPLTELIHWLQSGPRTASVDSEVTELKPGLGKRDVISSLLSYFSVATNLPQISLVPQQPSLHDQPDLAGSVIGSAKSVSIEKILSVWTQISKRMLWVTACPIRLWLNNHLCPDGLATQDFSRVPEPHQRPFPQYGPAQLAPQKKASREYQPVQQEPGSATKYDPVPAPARASTCKDQQLTTHIMP